MRFPQISVIFRPFFSKLGSFLGNIDGK